MNRDVEKGARKSLVVCQLQERGTFKNRKWWAGI